MSAGVSASTDRLLAALDRGVGFLLADRARGWERLTHRMRFERADGFRGPERQEGSTFQRAIVVECLLDVSRFLARFDEGDRADIAAGLREVAALEAEGILADRAQDVAGGWRYFPDLVELPPDADDLGQICQVFCRLRREELVDSVRDAVRLLVTRNVHSNGTFATWNLDPDDDSESASVLRDAVERWWGVRRGRDSEVTANALYGLSWLRDDAVAPVLQLAARGLERRQNADGSWPVEWYRDPEYGSFVALRALVQALPDSPAVPHGARFLLERQTSGGGWPGGWQPTALALDALRWLAGPEVDAAVARGRAYLLDAQRDDGGWSAQEFIIMLGGRFVYQSDEITTALCLRALANTAPAEEAGSN